MNIPLWANAPLCQYFLLCKYNCIITSHFKWPERKYCLGGPKCLWNIGTRWTLIIITWLKCTDPIFHYSLLIYMYIQLQVKMELVSFRMNDEATASVDWNMLVSPLTLINGKRKLAIPSSIILAIVLISPVGDLQMS